MKTCFVYFLCLLFFMVLGCDTEADERTYDLSAGHDIYNWMLAKSKAGR